MISSSHFQSSSLVGGWTHHVMNVGAVPGIDWHIKEQHCGPWLRDAAPHQRWLTIESDLPPILLVQWGASSPRPPEPVLKKDMSVIKKEIRRTVAKLTKCEQKARRGLLPRRPALPPMLWLQTLPSVSMQSDSLFVLSSGCTPDCAPRPSSSRGSSF